MPQLIDYGWTDEFAEAFASFGEKGSIAGRVVSENMNHIRLLTEQGEIPAKSSGSLYYKSSNKGDLPAVGDWVAVRLQDGEQPFGVIHAVLPRKSKFSRKIPGRVMVEQTLAANIDTVFIVMGLDSNFNLRRLERFLTIAWESGAQPVVLLNKMDLVVDAADREAETREVAGTAPVHIISALHGNNLGLPQQYLTPRTTTAILGSSGVGKSTLLNQLHGQDIQATKETGVAGKGVHTTRIRELFLMDNGAMVIDTPGLRELQLWNVEEGLTDTFADIREIARNCKFSDCKHGEEPGCAVKAAVDSGDLKPGRYRNYVEMGQELVSLEQRQDTKAMREKKRQDKIQHKHIKQYKKKHYKK